MGDRMRLIRLPIVLLIIASLGKLIGGFAGRPDEAGAQVGLVPLMVYLCIVWGALGRSVYAQELGSAAMLGVLIALVAQILIFGATFLSYTTGLETHFSDPVKIAREAQEIGFGEALVGRATSLVVNSALGAIGASIGYALGGFVPSKGSSV